MSNSSIFRKKQVAQILSDYETGVSEGHGLVKGLKLKDLTYFGIAAIIGGGVFSTIGHASADGGPAIALLYLGFAITCVFSAYCYAQFASILPISGSAYTYAYTSFGEIIAWVLGWNLILEYAISNVVVAISWSDYFTSLLDGFGLHLPRYFTLDYLTAARSIDKISAMKAANEAIPGYLAEAQTAWETAPSIFGFKLIADLPALAITLLITYLTYIGIKESTKANNFLVVFKVVVIIMVILIGAFYVTPANWFPFVPEGVSGVMKGVSAICFAYIGFDSISTTAEECENPQRDIPKAMIYSLVVCTVLYVLVVLVLTGMVPYKELGVGDPLAFVFSRINLNFVAGVVAVGAVIATTSALLVYQLGQPRIWMVMSRDGLLPKKFSTIHPKYKTPSFATIMVGFAVGIPALFMNLTELTDLTSIGTLFAFALVCGGILVMDANKNSTHQPKFKVPYINGQFLVLGTLLATIIITQWSLPEYFTSIFQDFSSEDTDLKTKSIIMLVFFTFWLALGIISFKQKFSLIPFIGLIVNLYLMTRLEVNNWSRFGIWCVLGIVIYLIYGYRKSRLNK